ncbi:MAG: ribonuclease HI family protein [Candidatus Micrarchaeota archaeon]|nr:ribonuclease HI family protein [Candidatus Micrarchaeota archaeon]
MRSMIITAYTDGAARGNPGPSASGYVICDQKGKRIAKMFFYNGRQTNNVAEYLAIIAALKKIDEEFGGKAELKLFSDSKLVVNQLSGNYKVKDANLKVLHKEASKIAARLAKCEFVSVPRENPLISMVDGKLNELLDNIKKDESDIVAIKDARKGAQKGLFG